MKNKKTILFSVIFTAILLFVLLINIELHDIYENIKKVKLIYILPAFLFHIGAYVFRSLSFYLVTEKGKISFSELLFAHFVHNFYLHMIPANLGELSFPILLKGKLKTEESLSMLFISRFISMIATVLLFLLSLFFVFQWKNSFVLNIQLYSIILAVIVIFVFILYYFRTKLISFFSRNSLLKRMISKIISLLESVKNDILKFKSIRFSVMYVLSIVVSLLSVSYFYLFILKGMGIETTIFQVIFVSSIGIAFVLLPIKSIGGFGTTEGAWTVGLMLLGFTKELSITAGFVVHLYALINVIIFFFIGLIFRYLSKK